MEYVQSIVAILAFLGLWVVIYLNKRSEKKLNGITWFAISFSIEVCLTALVVGIINLIHIPITILSVSIVEICLALIFAIDIYRKKAIQKYNYDKLQILGVFGLLAVTYFVFVLCYGLHWGFAFRNTDAAAHMENALWVIDNKEVTGMYLASLFNGMVMKTLGAWMTPSGIYRAYLASELLMLFMEMLTFFCLLLAFCKKKRDTIYAWIVTILYMAGYPLLCLAMSFYYWGIAIMFVVVSMILIKYYKDTVIERSRIELQLMILCFGTLITYMLMAPPMYIAIFASLFIIYAREGKVFTKNNVLVAFKIFLLPCVLGLYYSFVDWFVGGGMDVGEVAIKEGGIYRQLYVDFIFLMPALIYMILKCIRNRKWDFQLVFLSPFLVMTLGMLVLMYRGDVSTYYYSKIYYPLWMIGFVILFVVLLELRETNKEMLGTYIIMFLIPVFLFGTKTEKKIIEKTQISKIDYSEQALSMYVYNRRLLRIGPMTRDGLLEIFDWIKSNEELQDTLIPMIVGEDCYASTFYFDTLMHQYSNDYYGWTHSIEELQQEISEGNCEAAVIMTNSLAYADNAQYWDQFEVLYQANVYRIIKTK